MMLRVTELEEFTPKQKQHLETAINEAKKQQGAWGKKPVIITPKQLKAAEERLKELNNAEEAIRKAIQDPIDPKKLDNAIQEAEKVRYQAPRLEDAKDKRDRLQATQKLTKALRSTKPKAWKEAIEMAEGIQKADKQKDKATKKNADEKGKTENKRRPSMFDPPQLREVKKKLSMKDLEVITRINTRARARARTRAHAPVNRNRIPLLQIILRIFCRSIALRHGGTIVGDLLRYQV